MSDLSRSIVASFEPAVADVLAGRLDSPALGETLRALFPDERAAWPERHRVRSFAWRDTAVVAVEADRPPVLTVDAATPTPEPMDAVPGTGLWVRAVSVTAGRCTLFGARVDGYPAGGGLSPHALVGYSELSHPRPGVPEGVLTERRTLTSAVYDGASVEYRLYLNDGIDTERGAPLMIWLDGAGFTGTADALGPRMQVVSDNLVAAGAIPPMAHLLLSAGSGGTRILTGDDYFTGRYNFRLHQFDEVTEEFNRHLIHEVLPAVEAEVPLRPNAYSRGIYGASSGGVAAFKVGWFSPDVVSRLYPYIAAFDAWGWRPRSPGVDGAHLLPLWVRREPRKNLRVWLSAGEHDEFDSPAPAHLEYDLETRAPFEPALRYAGSQPLALFEMAQALKVTGYDFRLRFGVSGHDMAQLSVELPESLAWLWREYDPERTEQVYEPDEEERRAPPFRFGVVNRDVGQRSPG